MSYAKDHGEKKTVVVEKKYMTAADHQEPLLKRREEQTLKHVELVGRIAPLLSAAIPR